MAARHAHTLKVFISYSRSDTAATDTLVDALRSRGGDVSIDRRDLPFGEKWQAELADFIRLADTVIWLISESSVQSKWVNWELDEVAKRNKRLVPLMIAETARDALPRQLGEIHILPAVGPFDIARDIDTLIRVLETDHAWLKQASRLQDRANEWLSKGHSPALLLSRGALLEAERWQNRQPSKVPAPAQEVLQLMLASRQAATRRQRWWTGGLALGGILATCLAAYALVQRGQAENERDRALQSESRARAGQATLTTTSGDAVSGILLALSGLPELTTGSAGKNMRPYVAEAEQALIAAWKSQREYAVLGGHTESVRSAEFNSSGTLVVTAGDDGVAKIWNVENGGLVATLSGHGANLYKAVFSPDGRKIATASADQTARIWDASSGEVVATLTGHTGGVTSLAFSPDSTRLATTSAEYESGADQTARIWDVKTGALLVTISGHGASVSSARFSFDGRRLVTASEDGTARIWDASDGRTIVVLKGHTSQVISAEFNGDGSRVATASIDHTARIWDAASGAVLQELKGQIGQLTSARFDAKGSRVVTAAGLIFDSNDFMPRIWDARSGASLAQLRGHSDFVNSAEFSPDASLVVTASNDMTARVWDSADGRQVAVLSAHSHWLHGARFSPDGSRIVTYSADGTARLWRLTVRTSFVAELKGHSGYVDHAAFDGRGIRILTTSYDNTGRLWNAQDGTPLATLLGHSDSIQSAEFSSDGEMVVTASDDRTARVWSASGERLFTLAEHTDRLNHAAFSPDGRYIVTASEDRTARVWEAKSGTVSLTLSGHKESIEFAAFSPDGRLIATASADQTVRLWEAASGRLVRILTGFGGTVDLAVFSPDGKRLLTVAKTDTNSTSLWDVDTGKLAVRLPGTANGARYSPDGSVQATAHAGIAKIWDAWTGDLIVTLTGHATKKGLGHAQIHNLSFGSDGRRVLTSSDDGTARLWDAKTGAVLDVISLGAGVQWAGISPTGGRALTLTNDGERPPRLWEVFPSYVHIVNRAKSDVPRCLSMGQRQAFLLPPEPPFWCIELRKYPFDTLDWKSWVAARKKGVKAALPTRAAVE